MTSKEYDISNKDKGCYCWELDFNTSTGKYDQCEYCIRKKKDRRDAVEILKSMGVTLHVSACGCCDGPDLFLEINDQVLFNYDNGNFDTDLKNLEKIELYEEQ